MTDNKGCTGIIRTGKRTGQVCGSPILVGDTGFCISHQISDEGKELKRQAVQRGAESLSNKALPLRRVKLRNPKDAVNLINELLRGLQNKTLSKDMVTIFLKAIEQYNKIYEGYEIEEKLKEYERQQEELNNTVT